MALSAYGEDEPTTKVVGEMRYTYHKQPLSWKAADGVCKQGGGTLITVTSTLVEDTMMELNGAKCLLSWVGYTDMVEEGTWQWSSGETSTFSHWMEGEPNDFEFDFEGRQDEPLCMMGYTEDMDTIDDWAGTGEDCAMVGWSCLWTNTDNVDLGVVGFTLWRPSSLLLRIPQ